MTDHRQRQEELARERLNQKLKKRKQTAQATEVPLPEDHSDEVGWQEAVTKEIEMKHTEERDVLVQVCLVLETLYKVDIIASQNMVRVECNSVEMDW